MSKYSPLLVINDSINISIYDSPIAEYSSDNESEVETAVKSVFILLRIASQVSYFSYSYPCTEKCFNSPFRVSAAPSRGPSFHEIALFVSCFRFFQPRLNLDTEISVLFIKRLLAVKTTVSFG